MKEIIQTKAVRKSIGLRKQIKSTSPQIIFKVFFYSAVFGRLSPSLIKLSTAKFPWNKTDKTATFTGIPPHVTILTMLEVIRIIWEGMVDELSGNIIAELRKRGTFGRFSEERMQLLLEVIWNKVEYSLKDPQKSAG